MTIKLVLEKEINFDGYEIVLGYKEIELLFNAGPFPGGGDCLIVKANGELMTINSNDLINDIDCYKMSEC